MKIQPLRILLITVYACLVFGITLFFATRAMNHSQEEETKEQEKATFPVVTLMIGETELNTLFGYARETDVSLFRGTLMLTDEGREFTVCFDETDAERAGSVFFEIRTTDGENLIEQTEIKEKHREGNRLTCSFRAKDLIDPDHEYMLVLKAMLETGQEVRYYSRFAVAPAEDLAVVQRHIGFCENLHDMAISGNADLRTYLESKKNTKTASVADVDIRSSFSAVSFEGLSIAHVTKPRVYLYDLHGEYACITLRYDLTLLQEETREMRYHVTEDYFTRISKNGTYLIDFKRGMEYVFTGEKEDIDNGKLHLSYAKETPLLTESASGNVFAFVNASRLFLYHQTDNRLTQVFGFYTTESDVRTNRDACDIRVLRMDEGGNLIFRVQGYMGCGSHEGEVGTGIYEFNAPDNAVTEMVWIPEDVPETHIGAGSGQIGYANYMGIYYCLRGEDLYAVNLYDGETVMVQQGLGAGIYRLSGGGNIIAWQDQELSDTVHVLDMGSEESMDLSVAPNTKLRLLGFIESDIVYGEVDDKQIRRDKTGEPVCPMKRILIQNMDGMTIAEYVNEEMPVTEVTLEENRLILHRILLTEDGYEQAPDDQVVSTVPVRENQNLVQTESLPGGNGWFIRMMKETDSDKRKLFTALFTQYEPALPSVEKKEEGSYYYTYDHGVLQGVYREAGEAVTAAYACCGQVVDGKGRYLYYRGNMTTRNQIMALTEAVKGKDYSGENSLNACLRVMLAYEGAGTNVNRSLADGMSALQILEKALPDAHVLELRGCPLAAMLYYVDLMCDYPVMAKTGSDTYVLLIGFNEREVVLFNPQMGTDSVYKIPVSEAEELFAAQGNRYLTYIR